MKIEVLFFAAARDAVGHASEALDVSARVTVHEVMEGLWPRYPHLARLRDTLRVAVNEDFVATEHVLAEGDRLALLPPVSGG